MKKRNLRIASGVLAMALLVSTNVFATTTAEYDAQISEIKEKQAQNEAEAEELNAQLESLRSETADAQAYQETLVAQIENYQESIDLARERIDELNSSISTVRNKFTSGTWTPSIDGKSGTGYYFKADKLCHVYGSVTLSAKMVTSKISGLPFTFYKTYDCLNIMFGEVTTATATGNSKIGPYVRNNGQIIYTDPKGEIYTGFNDWTAAGSVVYIWGVYRTT